RGEEIASLHDSARNVTVGMRLSDVMKARRTFEIVIEHANVFGALLWGHAIQYLVDDLAKIIAIAPRAAGALVDIRILHRLGGLEHLDRRRVAALFEI